MAPFLRDDGPPVSPETIEAARAELPVEYGYRLVTENGKQVLLVRSPRDKPDYLHELEDVALYVDLNEVREVSDVLLIGNAKVCRLEPLRLRDCVRDRLQEDQEAAAKFVKTLDRDYGFTLHEHAEGNPRLSLAVRVPHQSVTAFTPDDVRAIRERVGATLRDRLMDLTDGYVVADTDFERLGRRVFVEMLDPELAGQTAPRIRPEDPYRPAPVAAPTMQANLPRPQITQTARPRPEEAAPQARAQASTPPPQVNDPPAPPAEASPASDSQDELVSSDDDIEIYVRKQPQAEEATAEAPQPEPARQPEPRPTQRADPIVRASGPTHDNGDVSMAIPRAAETPERTDAITLLAEKLNGRQYEVVSGISVHGTTFDIAAHRREGKRLLVKRVDEATAAEVQSLDSVARGVGADACLMVADDVAPGARIASWGTSVEVLDPAEVLHLEL